MVTNVKTVHGLRILCIAEIRGQLTHLNALAKKHNADCIVHTGNFGFFDASSVARISDPILQQIVAFSPLIDATSLSSSTSINTSNTNSKANTKPTQDNKGALKRELLASKTWLSELPSFLSGSNTFSVPVYTIYGAAEDLTVLEKFRSGEYSVPNLHLIDETQSHALVTPTSLGGHTVRLFGLGGTLVMHQLFDNGGGVSTIAGSPGLMWTTILQMGQLLLTARKNFDASEIRIFVCHPPVAREGLLAQLAVSLRADYTVSSGLHFIYGSSFNEFSVLPSVDHYRGILAAARKQFLVVWNAVKSQLLDLVETDSKQKSLLLTAVNTFEAMPSSSSSVSASSETASEDSYLITAHRNMWHFNLCDAAFGALVLNVVDGRVATESYSEGFNFHYRRPIAQAVPTAPATTTTTTASTTTASASTTTTSKPVASIPTPYVVPSSSSSSSSIPPPAPPATTAPLPPSAPLAELPGLWIANASGGATSVRNLFAEPDRAHIQSIVVKENFLNPEKEFALVYFLTSEQVQRAMEGVDKGAARKVSVIRTHGHGYGSGNGKERGNGSGHGNANANGSQHGHGHGMRTGRPSLSYSARISGGATNTAPTTASTTNGHHKGGSTRGSGTFKGRAKTTA